MKRILPIALIILGAVVLILHFSKSRQIDIVGDLEEIRNTPTKAGEELNSHYENKAVFDSLVYSGEIDSALEFIDKIIDESSDSKFNDNYILEKGKLLYELKEYADANRVLSEAIIKSDSFNLNAFVWRSYSLAMMGQCESAILDINYALSQNSSFQKDYDNIQKYCKEDQ